MIGDKITDMYRNFRTMPESKVYKGIVVGLVASQLAFNATALRALQYFHLHKEMPYVSTHSFKEFAETYKDHIIDLKPMHGPLGKGFDDIFKSSK